MTTVINQSVRPHPCPLFSRQRAHNFASRFQQHQQSCSLHSIPKLCIPTCLTNPPVPSFFFSSSSLSFRFPFSFSFSVVHLPSLSTSRCPLSTAPTFNDWATSMAVGSFAPHFSLLTSTMQSFTPLASVATSNGI